MALGLRYLHEHSPPIIHRDLSANNVLLTSNMRAKLSDLGVAKMLNITPAQMTQQMSTQAPGTPCYMPPEALMARPTYTSKIDSYSYGVLMIHMLCGSWPFPADAFRHDHRNPDTLIPISEIDRRAKYLEDIRQDHPLMGLIHQCLSNTPTRRPEASEILCHVSGILSRIPEAYLNTIELEDIVQSLTAENHAKHYQIESLIALNQAKQSQNVSLTAQTQALQSRNESLTAQIQALESQNESLTAQTQALQSRNESLTAQTQALQPRNESLTTKTQVEHSEVEAIKAEVEQLSMQSQARASEPSSQQPLQSLRVDLESQVTECFT